RHLVFHPSGKYLFVVNELNSTVTSCSYQVANGVLTELQTTSTVEASHKGSKYPAAIRMHPSGKYVYASTRGDISSIAVFQVDKNGELFRIQVEEAVPAWPRDFNIDPSGQYLIVAGERSDEIELFRIEDETGKLERTQVKTALPSPGCVLYLD
ncbi:MAG: beta-propeller fold lactonase family protein, partial [Bacteroidales bacterium]|nr:beta-propeller fold lactonase family protein [Bacteroidales bacterium]